MSKDVWDYFLSLDLKVFDIYGMSECTGPQLGNYTVQDHKPNTLGKEFPGLHVKIQPMNDGPSKEITGTVHNFTFSVTLQMIQLICFYFKKLFSS